MPFSCCLSSPCSPFPALSTFLSIPACSASRVPAFIPLTPSLCHITPNPGSFFSSTLLLPSSYLPFFPHSISSSPCASTFVTSLPFSLSVYLLGFPFTLPYTRLPSFPSCHLICLPLLPLPTLSPYYPTRPTSLPFSMSPLPCAPPLPPFSQSPEHRAGREWSRLRQQYIAIWEIRCFVCYHSCSLCSFPPLIFIMFSMLGVRGCESRLRDVSPSLPCERGGGGL